MDGQQAERRGESGGGREIGSATLLDVTAERRLSRDRSYREQPARVPLVGASQTEGIDLALSHPAVGCMSAWKHHGRLFVAESMVGGAQMAAER